jgi:hypothetical protein
MKPAIVKTIFTTFHGVDFELEGEAWKGYRGSFHEPPYDPEMQLTRIMFRGRDVSDRNFRLLEKRHGKDMIEELWQKLFRDCER